MNSSDLNSLDRKCVAISEIAASIGRGESRCFFVALVGYYVEGYPYPASGLSVDTGGISDMQLSDVGFSCQAKFTPEQLRPEIILAKGTVSVMFKGEVHNVVPVQVKVKFEDIWAVLETVEDEQIELYKDFASMEPSMMRFTRLWREYLDESDPNPQ